MECDLSFFLFFFLRCFSCFFVSFARWGGKFCAPRAISTRMSKVQESLKIAQSSFEKKFLPLSFFHSPQSFPPSFFEPATLFLNLLQQIFEQCLPPLLLTQNFVLPAERKGRLRNALDANGALIVVRIVKEKTGDNIRKYASPTVLNALAASKPSTTPTSVSVPFPILLILSEIMVVVLGK